MRLLHNSNHGAVMVELAMILPLLLVMFVGVLDFGFLIREHQILQNAAREGARFASLQANSIELGPDAAAKTSREAAIKARVVNYLAVENVTISATSITVAQNQGGAGNTCTIDLGGGFSATCVKVTASYPRALFIGGTGWPFYGPLTLRAEAIFRNLY